MIETTGFETLGAIGMSVFAIDLYFASRGFPPSASMTLPQFVAIPAHWRVTLVRSASFWRKP